eukprot:scaffold321925_cov32-Tisochrysis_lutea.AAC.1
MSARRLAALPPSSRQRLLLAPKPFRASRCNAMRAWILHVELGRCHPSLTHYECLGIPFPQNGHSTPLTYPDPLLPSLSTNAFKRWQVDVWAAGVSLYLLVTGKVPFEGSSLIQARDAMTTSCALEKVQA